MKLKNTTNSVRELMDKSTGKIIQVEPYGIIELDICLYDKNSFKIANTEVTKPNYTKNSKKSKNRTSTTRRLIKNDTSN